MSSAPFQFTVENIMILEHDVTLLSPPVYIRMLPWKIMVMPHRRALSFFIQCNGEDDSPTWSCRAVAELRIKSHKPNTPPFTRGKIEHLFNSKENDYGYSNFITWQDLQDPEKGYIHNGAITLAVDLIADAPIGVALESESKSNL